jgi:hypothetical protein
VVDPPLHGDGVVGEWSGGSQPVFSVVFLEPNGQIIRRTRDFTFGTFG